MKVGILGAGQLGRMLALAGYPLGLEFAFFDPEPTSPAFSLGTAVCAPYSERALKEFARSVDVLTFEFENVPAELLAAASEAVPLRPSAESLLSTRDRLVEKRLLSSLGIPTAPFFDVPDLDAFREAYERCSLRGILKTRTLGYDGKGQLRLEGPGYDEAEVRRFLERPSILEGYVPFEREFSVIASRSPDGAVAYYPLTENRHEAGILRTSIAPSPHASPSLQAEAERYAGLLLAKLGYVGTMAVELFHTGESLVANEVAPRVHNSGHWTIEGTVTSQFENHLRAVAGLPLGSTAPLGHAGMVNLIGSAPPAAEILAIPGPHLHLYGKTPRPGRKIGHVTVVCGTAGERDEALKGLAALADGVEGQ